MHPFLLTSAYCVLWVALATVAALEPRVVFEENFDAYVDGEQPGSLVELHNLHFTYGEVIDRRYAVHHGHRHMPIMPRVSNFDWSFTVTPHPRTLRSPVLILEFRKPSPVGGQGYRLEHVFGAEHRLQLFYRGQRIAQADAATLELPTSAPIRFRLTAQDDHIRFYRNDSLLLAVDHTAEGSHDAGHLAFSAQYFHGRQDVVSPLFFDDFRITSTDTLPEPIRHYARAFEVPRHVRAAHTRIMHRLEIDRIGDTGLDAVRSDAPGGQVYRVRASLDFPIMSRGRRIQRYRDMAAQTPYLRIETPDGEPILDQRIFNGILGGLLPGRGGGAAQILRLMTQPGDPVRYGVDTRMAQAADATGPQQVITTLTDLPETFHIVAGWTFFLDRDHMESSGPVEAIFTQDGALLYAGEPLPRGKRALRLISPPSPGILARVAPDNPMRAGFIERLERNHYALEGEAVHFTVHQYTGPGTDPHAAVRWVLRDGFRRALSRDGELAFTPVEEGRMAEQLAQAGRRVFTSATLDLGRLAAGVYWLDLHSGDQVKRRAFSVVPAEHRPGNSAALASGLPWVRGQFYPTQPWPKDAAHLVTRAGTRSPAWTELVHAFNLEAMWDQRPPIDDDNLRTIQGIWATGITPRTYRLLEAQTAQPPIPYAGYRLWRDVYNPWGTRYDAETVSHFLQSDAYHPHPGDGVLYDESAADAARWQQIQDHHFKQWIDFWCEVYAVSNDARRRDLDAIRPDLSLMAYGPPLINSLYYGNLYAAKYYGYDWKRIDGRRQMIDIYQMETYAHDFGRHPASYTPSIALTRMTFPWMGTAWEIYGANGYVIDSRTQEGRAPHGLGYPSRNFMAHQVLELSLAPWFLDADGFQPAGMSHVAPDTGAMPQELLLGMIDGWRAATEAQAVRPVRSAAFVRSYEAAEADPSWERPEITNAAAEAPAYAYLQWRLAGLPTGFFVDANHLDHITAENTDVLVLPSMRGATAAQIATVRRLHDQGIALVCFDDASGLEERFGIRRAVEGVAIHAVQRAQGDTRLGHLPAPVRNERIPHRGLVHYAVDGAEALLEGLDADFRPVAPLLTLYRKVGQAPTLFFAQGATDVGRRRDPWHAHQIEGEINSRLIQQSLRVALREIARPLVSVSEPAAALVFENTDGGHTIIVSEASFPFGNGQPVEVILQINLAESYHTSIHTHKPMRPVASRATDRTFAMTLDPDEIVTIKLGVPDR